ncbi:SNARE-binding exocyst subunit S6 [Elasticomyces elasticus]|nr:SNARE-binding exocyst subunit S6 [Elasticomyces elasticus]
MEDSSDAPTLLSSLLRHPDDLSKLPALRAEFLRKKTTVDATLKAGLQEQLQVTQAGMTHISDGQRVVNQIKEEMMTIDKLCAESQALIKDFPHINLVSQTHRNFVAVEEMRTEIEKFGSNLEEVEALLREDDQDLENQPNLLAVHYGLSHLRDVRDMAMEQTRNDTESSGALELVNNLPLDSAGGATLQDHFTRLDEAVDSFDEHIGQACMNLITLVQSGNNGLVVRLALVIDEEEKKDKQVKALQNAQREYKELALRFKSIAAGPKELRGYKENFLKAIQLNAQNGFDAPNGSRETFLGDPDRLEKSLRWYFNDLNTVKLGLSSLMPPKWRIFKTYVQIYHTQMRSFLLSLVDSSDLQSPHILAIIHWIPKYYQKMTRLGVESDVKELQPHVIDERDEELIREYRALITKAVEQWMERMQRSDLQSLLSRSSSSSDLDNDVNGCLRTKTVGDMWKMLHEQLGVAAESSLPSVVEGVIDSMIRALHVRQEAWTSLLSSEVQKYATATASSDAEGLQPLQDWLMAIANDQIACIDDDPVFGSQSYLSRFQDTYEPVVSPAYAISSQAQLEALRDGYVDLSTHCIHLFSSLIFTVDFRSLLSELFTTSWLNPQGQHMKQIISTFEDYLGDYTHALHPSLRDILVEELADALLIKYLSAVHNRGVKFRRMENYQGKIKEDVLAIFAFFGNYEHSFPTIKDNWRVVSLFVELLDAPKDGQSVVAAYERFKTAYWDLQLSWVEAVLRARDDSERGMLNTVKGRAAEMYVERQAETVMSKVK